MTEEKIQQIKTRLDAAIKEPGRLYSSDVAFLNDLSDLLCEIERLKNIPKKQTKNDETEERFVTLSYETVIAILGALNVGQIMAEKVIKFLDTKKSLSSQVLSLNAIIEKNKAVIAAAQSLCDHERIYDIAVLRMENGSYFCPRCVNSSKTYNGIDHEPQCSWNLRCILAKALNDLAKAE